MPAELESNQTDDLRLVRDAVAGDEARVRQLCDRLLCVPRIVKSLNHRMGRPLGDADLEDTSQDAMGRIWQKLPEFEGRARFETWCYRFCFLTFMNALRRTQRLSKIERLEPAGPISEDSGAAQSLLDFERVQQVLESLPAPDAEVIRLKYFNELSFREIAEVLRVSATSAKTYFHRGMERLKRAIR